MGDLDEGEAKMKTLIIVLSIGILSLAAWAGPYEVIYSSSPACVCKDAPGICAESIECGREYYSVGAFSCMGDREQCEWVYDLAYALNKAHEERTATLKIIHCPGKGCSE